MSRWNKIHKKGDPLHISHDQENKTRITLNAQMNSLCGRATKILREKSKYDGISTQNITDEPNSNVNQDEPEDDDDF